MQNTELLLKELTLEEKCALLSGAETFETRGMPKHGIPQIWLSDGPHGLRKQAGESDHLGLNPSVPATCFPTASAVANSWDAALGEEIGAALGEEAAAQEVSVVLGPGLNMKRNPLCGRSFEYFSEDPYLAGKLAAGYIRGIQSKGVAACPKHFAVNSQETRRMASDSIVDERTLREIYLTGFEIAVKEGHPRSIMSSYNLVNGTYANENKHLLMEILRGEWGFDGAVITDWGGSNDHALGVKNGSTLEMPAPGGDSVRELLTAVESGKISESDIDARLSELLPLVFDTKAALDAAPREFDAAAHHALARRAAEESLVLLKNEGALLPLAAGSKVAVIGDFAKNPRYQGAGSSMVNSTQVDVLLDKLIDSELNVIGYQQGFDRHGKPDAALQKSACELATQADTVILCMGLDEIAESEGLDRSNLRLAQNQVDLLQAVAAVNPKIVVVLYSGSVVETPWLDNCQALLYAALGGQAGAGAVADALTGKVNPCGKLAETWPLAYADVPSAADFATRRKTVEYREGLYIGYRYFTTAEKAVRFSFGYGLSYTSFDWELENTSPTTVTAQDTLEWNVKVTNTGNVAGKDVVELYYSAPYYSAAEGGSGLQKAGEVLGGFAKTKELQPGETETVTISMPVEQMASYDAQKYYTSTGSYVLEAGEYQISLRTDSHTVKDNLTMTCKVAENEVFQDSAFGSGVENCKYVGKRSSDEVVATNQFDDAAGDVAYLNRDTWQIVPGTSKEATAEQLEAFNNALLVDDSYVDADDTAPTFGAKNGLTLKDMEGLAYDDAQWDKLLDQLTLDDMYKLLGADGWGSAAVDNIGKGQTYEMDGPAALSYVFDAFMGTCTYKTVTYPAEVLLAATWNVDLASEFGDAISQEGKAWNISGWYAPGANTHRNAFAGRNF